MNIYFYQYIQFCILKKHSLKVHYLYYYCKSSILLFEFLYLILCFYVFQQDKENLSDATQNIMFACIRNTSKTATTSPSISPLYCTLDPPPVKPRVNKHKDSSKKECKRSLFTDKSRTDIEAYCKNMGLHGVTKINSSKWSKPLALTRMASEENSKSNLLNLNYPKTIQEVEEALTCATEAKPANVLMVALRTHTPSLPDCNELYLPKGTVVCGLFRTKKWVCIRLPSHTVGYVPVECLDAIGVKKCKDFSQQFPTWITLDDKPVFEKIIQQETKVCQNNGDSKNSPMDATVDESVYVEADDICNHVYSDMSKVASTQVTADSGIVDDVENSHVSYTVCYKDKQRLPIYIKKQLPLTPLLSDDKDQQCRGEGHMSIFNNDSAVLKMTKSLCSKEPSPSDPDNGYESSGGECGSAYDVQPTLSEYSVSQDSGRESTDHEQSVYSPLLPTVAMKSGCNQLEQVSGPLETNYNKKHGALNKSSETSHKHECIVARNSQTKSDCEKDKTCHNLTVLFDYDRNDKHCICIKKGQVVQLIHDKHKNWLWVRNQEGVEGYIPKNYVVNLEALNLDPHTQTTYF